MTAALILLVILAAAVAITLVLFARVRPATRWLLAPYLAWVLFAGVLNYQFLLANPDADGRPVSGAATRIEL